MAYQRRTVFDFDKKSCRYLRKLNLICLIFVVIVVHLVWNCFKYIDICRIDIGIKLATHDIIFKARIGLVRLFVFLPLQRVSEFWPGNAFLTKVSCLTSTRETWLIPPDNLGWNLIWVSRVQGSKAPFWKVKAWLCLLTCRLSSFSFWATNKLSNFSTWKSLQHFEPCSHETISLDALFSSQLSNTNLAIPLPINAARLKQPFLSLRLRNAFWHQFLVLKNKYKSYSNLSTYGALENPRRLAQP